MKKGVPLEALYRHKKQTLSWDCFCAWCDGRMSVISEETF